MRIILPKLTSRIMKKALKYSAILLLVWVSLARCFISKNRLSDSKAQQVFASKHVPVSILDTVINHRHLHYAISGSPSLPTLIIIHGSPGSWMNYMKFMYDSSLLKKFRMVAIDRPGFGYSDFGDALHLQEQAKLILPLIESLKNNQPIYLMGHSYGGPLIVQLAASEPGLFKQIILVAGAIDVRQEKKETWRKVMEVKPLYWLLPGSFAPSNTELLYLKQDLIPLESEMSKVTCEVHFVHGSKDTWVPIENIAFGKKMMVNARSIMADTIINADHQIPWKNRQELIEILGKLY
jgi:hypothetical protein